MLPAEMEADNEWRLAYASVVADPTWYGMEVGSGGGVAGGVRCRCLRKRSTRRMKPLWSMCPKDRVFFHCFVDLRKEGPGFVRGSYTTIEEPRRICAAHSAWGIPSLGDIFVLRLMERPVPNDKCQATGTPVVCRNGTVLLFQCIWRGRTVLCHPRGEIPQGMPVYHNQSCAFSITIESFHHKMKCTTLLLTIRRRSARRGRPSTPYWSVSMRHIWRRLVGLVAPRCW